MENKILLVDDDPDDREILQDAFKTIKAEQMLHFESNGESAIRYIEDQFELGQLPALVVLDMNMPKLSGTQTLRLIRSDSRFEKIPVVIFSTSLNDKEKKECMELGAHSYLIKPIYYNESIETARQFYRIVTNEDPAE